MLDKSSPSLAAVSVSRFIITDWTFTYASKDLNQAGVVCEEKVPLDQAVYKYSVSWLQVEKEKPMEANLQFGELS